MLSNKPYLMRAFYDWIVDSGFTPLVVLNARHPKCRLPVEFATTDGEIVFNISPSAIRDLKITNVSIEFRASFTGVIHVISAPIKAVNAVYAEENNEGVFFDADESIDDASETVKLVGIEGSANVTSISKKDSGPHSPENIVPVKDKPVLKLIE